MVCISAPRALLRCMGQAYLMSFLEEHDLSAKWVKMVGKGVVRVTAFDGNVPLLTSCVSCVVTRMRKV